MRGDGADKRENGPTVPNTWGAHNTKHLGDGLEAGAQYQTFWGAGSVQY
jgi:hypothetical protein